MITAVSAAALEHKDRIIKLAHSFDCRWFTPIGFCGSRRLDELRNRHLLDSTNALQVTLTGSSRGESLPTSDKESRQWEDEVASVRSRTAGTTLMRTVETVDWKNP